MGMADRDTRTRCPGRGTRPPGDGSRSTVPMARGAGRAGVNAAARWTAMAGFVTVGACALKSGCLSGIRGRFGHSVLV